MGFAAAKRFVEEGAHVFVVGRTPEKLERALAELGPAAGGRAADVAVEVDVEAAHDEALAFLGRLDAVFVNAGVDGQNRGCLDIDVHLDDPEIAADIVAHIPLGRVGTADEIARLVSFLAEPEAAYLNGAIVNVDGGRMA
jgi:NAD(P)-dependent dehydrogenase (short-subunit alcohol dehydrogenase family)